MNGFIMIDDYLVDDGLCLLDIGNNIMLASISFPTEEYTIKEYQEWEREIVNNAIFLSSPEFYPMDFYKNKIEEAQNVGMIAKEEFEEFDNLEEKDVAIPIVGGLKEDYFRELLTKLWNTEGEHIQDYSSAVREYYREVFKRNGGELD